MASTALPAWLARRNIHYGWIIVGATLLTTVITAAAMSTPGVLIVPLEKEFGWTDAQISSALALRLMLFGLFGPFAAAFMNRYGVRAVMVSAVILISAGFLASLVMAQVWQLVLLWGIVVGVGTGLTAMVLAVTVATRWFNARRGLVMGIFAASNATGQLIFLPLIALLDTDYGWRMSLVFICCMLALAGIVALLSHARPAERLGLPLYGETAVAPPPAGGVGLVSLLLSPLIVLQDCRARADLLGPVRHVLRLRLQHQRPDPDAFHLALRRLRARRDARRRVLAMMGFFDFFGTIGSGWLSDRFDQPLAAVLVLRPARAVAAVSAVHRFHASTACRCSRCSMASTGSPPCRRR